MPSQVLRYAEPLQQKSGSPEVETLDMALVDQRMRQAPEENTAQDQLIAPYGAFRPS